MDRLGRMPVWASIDAIRKHWLTWLLIQDAGYGAVNILGRPESDPLLLPIAGTCLLLVSCALIGLGWSILGAGISSFAWSVFAFAWVMSVVSGTPASYGDLVLLIGMGGWHMLVVYEVGTGLDELREHQQRASGL